MSDLIDRQAAIDALTEYGNGRAVFISVGEAVIRIEQLPPANCSEIPNNSDTISREAVADAINGIECTRHTTWYEFYQKVMTAVEKLPSAEPKRGKWISADAIFGGVPFYCSECGENTWDTVMGKPRWNFCPNCGSYNGGGT